MSFESELGHLVDTDVAGGLQAFASELDAAWVSAALERGCPATLRRRKLPAGARLDSNVVGGGCRRGHRREAPVPSVRSLLRARRVCALGLTELS
jgi:hypothetical protein